ncbi:MAG: endonuclease/exonuclease/phosphatase family protein [Cellulophaga sp.]
MLKKIVLSVLLLFSFFGFSQKAEIRLISWNIQDFGKTKSSDELNEIAEIVKKADILAIQEVVAGYGGAQAVAKLTDILNRKGSTWDYVISNPTNSPKYVTERYAFIWKTRHIKIKNRGRLVTELDSMIDREPFLLDFYLGKKKFTVLNFHSRPFNKNPEREIIALTKFVVNPLKSALIIAGDFNVYEQNNVFDEIRANNFATAISKQKTTLKKACDKNVYLNHPIDNIFYSTEIYKIEGKVIDFVRFCGNLKKARTLSDHLPVFLAFNLE